LFFCMYLTAEDFSAENFDALAAVRKWRRRANYAEMEKAVSEVEMSCRSEIASDTVTHFARQIFERMQKAETTRPEIFRWEPCEVAEVAEIRKLLDERRALARERTTLNFVEVQLRRLRRAGASGSEIMSIRRSLEKFPWGRDGAVVDAGLRSVRDAARRRAEEILARENFLSAFAELEILGFHVQAAEKYLNLHFLNKTFTEFRDFVSSAFAVKKRLLEGVQQQVSPVLETFKARVFQRLERLFPGRLYPDVAALETFQTDFALCEQLFDRDVLYLEKFRTSAYLVCVGKTLEAADAVGALVRLWREFFVAFLYPEILRKSLEIISGCSRVVELEALLERKREILAEIAARTRPELRPEVAELLERAFAKAQGAVEEKLEAETSEIVAKVCAQLEGVKQVPMLYRLTSKAFPTRCSAYVDAAVKALKSGTSVLGETGKGKVKSEILASFRKRIDDIKTTDEKTLAQLNLDWDEVARILGELLGQ
jgi:hypothetical protein